MLRPSRFLLPLVAVLLAAGCSDTTGPRIPQPEPEEPEEPPPSNPGVTLDQSALWLRLG